MQPFAAFRPLLRDREIGNDTTEPDDTAVSDKLEDAGPLNDENRIGLQRRTDFSPAGQAFGLPAK